MKAATYNLLINKRASFVFDFIVLGDSEARNAKVVLSGLAAVRPVAGMKHRVYFATDTNVVSYDDGTAWSTVVPVDLTGSTVSSKVKNKATDSSSIVNFTTTIVVPTKGRVRLSLTASQTTSLNFTTAIYDVLISFTSGEVWKYLEGNVVLDKTVS